MAIYCGCQLEPHPTVKMPDNNLLNIDPNVLFEQHSITEIDEIQKKLLLEIERKKEELRIMVGLVKSTSNGY